MTCFDSYDSLCFKIIDRVNSKFDLKIKEALHINWRKPNLNVQQNHLALILSLKLLFPLLSSVFVCLITLAAITSSHYNTPFIISFSFIYCFHYLYANYWHL